MNTCLRELEPLCGSVLFATRATALHRFPSMAFLCRTQGQSGPSGTERISFSFQNGTERTSGTESTTGTQRTMSRALCCATECKLTLSVGPSAQVGPNALFFLGTERIDLLLGASLNPKL
jgi:hypothetical protein